MIGCHYKFRKILAKMTETIYKPASKLCENGKYHGCWSIYEDGTRKLISKNFLCKYPTDDPFWKKPEDVNFKIKTRAQKRKIQKPYREDVLDYLTIESDNTEFELKPNDPIVNYVTAW